MTELKPCPFCGKNVAVMTDAHDLEECSNFEDDNCHCNEFESHPCEYKTVVCDVTRGGCGASSGYYPTEEKSIEKWNRRAETVKEQFSADVAEVRHARWNNGSCTNCGYKTEIENIGFNCSGTASVVHYKHTNYCPNCGAKMDGKAGDDT